MADHEVRSFALCLQDDSVINVEAHEDSSDTCPRITYLQSDIIPLPGNLPWRPILDKLAYFLNSQQPRITLKKNPAIVRDVVARTCALTIRAFVTTGLFGAIEHMLDFATCGTPRRAPALLLCIRNIKIVRQRSKLPKRGVTCLA